MPYQLKRGMPYFLIILVAGLILLPQIITKVPLIGIDSIFHMNRFYDTAMQIKTGHFNYFQSFFGFKQSGRIINALYGPFFAYLNGFLLLLVKNWFNYQVLSSFLILITSGMLMNYLLVKNQVAKKYSTLIALLYMFSTPITDWVVGQQFTGWGAALMPLLLLSGTQMIKDRDIHVIPLVIGMTVLLETHVLSSLVGVVGLIPFFIIGWIQSNHRWKMIKHALISVILTLLLTFNVWGGTLDVFGSNQLIPVAPQTELDQDALSLFDPNDTPLNPIFMVLFVITLVMMIIYWKRLERETKIIALIGTFFLWISSHFFPWTTLNHLIPNLSYYLQMPKRFDVIAFTLLLLAFGKMLSNPSIQWTKLAKITLLGASVLFLGLELGSSIFHGINKWNTNQVLANAYNDHFHVKDNQKLRNSFYDSDLSKSIKYVSKATPDYLPIKISLPPDQYYNFHPYGNYDQQIVYYDNHYHVPIQKQVKSNQLRLNWNNGELRDNLIQLPVIKYAHTVVSLNGKQLKNVETSNIGAIKVHAKVGMNSVNVSYQPNHLFKIGALISLLSWLGLFIFLIIKKILQKRSS